MNSSETSYRRVGTFTFGLTLVAAGCAMLAAMYWPGFDLQWMLQLSPLLLVCLGIETLIAAKGSQRIKYDWVGMFLCCLIVCTALGLFAVTWLSLHYPDWMIAL